jgi:hypothetical protein
MARFVYQLAAAWEVDPLSFPSFDELDALMDEVEQVLVAQFEAQITRAAGQQLNAMSATNNPRACPCGNRG